MGKTRRRSGGKRRHRGGFGGDADPGTTLFQQSEQQMKTQADRNREKALEELEAAKESGDERAIADAKSKVDRFTKKGDLHKSSMAISADEQARRDAEKKKQQCQERYDDYTRDHPHVKEESAKSTIRKLPECHGDAGAVLIGGRRRRRRTKRHGKKSKKSKRRKSSKRRRRTRRH